MSAISDCRFLVEVSIRPREELVDVKSQYIRIISKIHALELSRPLDLHPDMLCL